MKKNYFPAVKPIVLQLREFLYNADKRALAFVSFLAGTLIFLNYFFGIDSYITNQPDILVRITLRYLLHLVAFGVPYLFYIFPEKNRGNKNQLILLIFVAPLIFALKMSFRWPSFSKWDIFWEQVVYWPVLLIMVVAILFACSKLFRSPALFLRVPKTLNPWPYFYMLLIMVPLIAFAAFQQQFQEVYPKLFKIEAPSTVNVPSWLRIIVFEIAYGSDFITIELFFRGFLILGFIKWAGKYAILPMAVFYCVIHFGKPPLECISSYFGGIILGVIVYHSRSVIGGLIVHLGIAWMMEVAGYVAYVLKK